MRDNLLWRLLGAQLLVIAIAVAFSALAISQLAQHSFMAIMTRYHIDPTPIAVDFQVMSRRILLVGGLVAATVAMLLGWALATRLVRRLQQMMALAERIAEGDYGRRVESLGHDEIGRLADSLNRMAASLQRIEELRRDLVANVAHELRTPLTTLRGYLEALDDGVTPPSRETLGMLHEEVLRLVRLVDDLHQLSQFDARVSGLRRSTVDLRAIVGRLVAVYGPEFTRRGLSIRELFDARLPPVEADADLVAQALRNLLDNAMRYSFPGSMVMVSTRVENGAVRLAVSNTGEGIPPVDLPRIFERFYRGEKSRSRATGGAGIGLAIVKEIAQAHGGEVGASSADGLTTVWFSLPVYHGATVPASAERPAVTAAVEEGL